MDQISMFELLERKEPDFTGMTEAEIVNYIGEAVGLDFTPRPIGGYMCKVKYLEFHIQMSTYTCTDREGLPFIGCDYWNRNIHGGAGVPCDSLGEAIEFFNHYKRQEV